MEIQTTLAKPTNLAALARRLKASAPDAVVLIQLDPRSDFYDAFDDSARALAESCDVTPRETIHGLRAAVPAFRIGHYVEQLLAAGHRVALCEREA